MYTLFHIHLLYEKMCFEVQQIPDFYALITAIEVSKLTAESQQGLFELDLLCPGLDIERTSFSWGRILRFMKMRFLKSNIVPGIVPREYSVLSL